MCKYIINENIEYIYHKNVVYTNHKISHLGQEALHTDNFWNYWVKKCEVISRYIIIQEVL